MPSWYHSTKFLPSSSMALGRVLSMQSTRVTAYHCFVHEKVSCRRKHSSVLLGQQDVVKPAMCSAWAEQWLFHHLAVCVSLLHVDPFQCCSSCYGVQVGCAHAGAAPAGPSLPDRVQH